MSKTQQLQAKAATLPEQIAAEVLDFLDFLIEKRNHEQPSRNEAIIRFRGAFKGRLSTSTEFAARKADEIRLEK
ncbi:MAG: DUF2281 domain-containing protein [Verrucomicrobiota bacterium]